MEHLSSGSGAHKDIDTTGAGSARVGREKLQDDKGAHSATSPEAPSPVPPPPSESATSNEDLHDASLFCFTDEAHNPTPISIRRSTTPPEGVLEQTHFELCHNTEGIRYSLSYLLEQHTDGVVTLHGYVREIGTLPLLSGPFGLAEDDCVMRFLMNSNGTPADSRYLSRDAFNIAEVFSSAGILGLNEYLSDLSTKLGSAQASVFHSPRLRKLLHESANQDDGLECDTESEYETPMWRDSLFNKHLEKIRAVERQLVAIDDISNEEHRNQRGEIGDILKQGHLFEERDDKDANRKAFDTAHIRRTLPSFRYWVDFITPDCDPRCSSVVSLLLPPIRSLEPECMQCLTIEIMGPSNFFGFRERYALHDRENVLNISSYGLNQHLFRNLFRLLHHINTPQSVKKDGVIKVLELLKEYGLHAKPVGLRSRIRAAIERISRPNIS